MRAVTFGVCWALVREAFLQPACERELAEEQEALTGFAGAWVETSPRPTSQVWAKIRRGESVSVATLGGSSSVGAGIGFDRTKTFGGRVVATLNAVLRGCDPQGKLGRFVAWNAAHGFANSFWSSLMLDSLVTAPDVLLWEYGINDMALGKGGASADDGSAVAFGLDAWLRRASTLPGPPPVFLAYLGLPPAKEQSWALQAATRQRFAAAGMDLTALNLAAYYRAAGVEPTTQLADEHHPNAAAHAAAARIVAEQLLLRRSASAAAAPVTLPPVQPPGDAQCAHLLRLATAPARSRLSWRPHVQNHNLGAATVLDDLAAPWTRGAWSSLPHKRAATVPCCRDGGLRFPLQGRVSALTTKARGRLVHKLEGPDGSTHAVQPGFVGGPAQEWDTDLSATPVHALESCALLRVIDVSGHFSQWMTVDPPVPAAAWTVCSEECHDLGAVSWMVSFAA